MRPPLRKATAVSQSLARLTPGGPPDTCPPAWQGRALQWAVRPARLQSIDNFTPAALSYPPVATGHRLSLCGVIPLGSFILVHMDTSRIRIAPKPMLRGVIRMTGRGWRVILPGLF